MLQQNSEHCVLLLEPGGKCGLPEHVATAPPDLNLAAISGKVELGCAAVPGDEREYTQMSSSSEPDPAPPPSPVRKRMPASSMARKDTLPHLPLERNIDDEKDWLR